jgi:tetratricopeptide (TPR) repeat protein
VGVGVVWRLPSLITLILIGASDLLSGQPPPESRLQREQWRQCKSADPAQAIVACADLIRSGNRADATLAEAFKERGRAYFRKGDYDRAIEDFDHALQIKPDYEDGFIARGSA